MKFLYDLIQTPVITEKSTFVGEQGKYIFKISKFADKSKVKNAIEKIFSVNVTKVNIINIAGKAKRFKGTMGKRADTKKAIVTLKSGQEIDITGGVK